MTSPHFHTPPLPVFEWLREISDVENAHSAHIVRRLMGNDFSQQNQSEILQQLQQELINHQNNFQHLIYMH